MPENITVVINGKGVQVAQGTVVSAVLLQTGQACRISVSGQPRTALCGMGICFECRAVVDGVSQRRTCQIFCADGMTVGTVR
jgi:hypothetical protein